MIKFDDVVSVFTEAKSNPLGKKIDLEDAHRNMTWHTSESLKKLTDNFGWKWTDIYLKKTTSAKEGRFPRVTLFGTNEKGKKVKLKILPNRHAILTMDDGKTYNTFSIRDLVGKLGMAKKSKILKSQGRKNYPNGMKFGKYQVLQPGRVGYKIPFDAERSQLSKRTRENIELLENAGWEIFDYCIKSPIAQKGGNIAHTVLVPGKDNQGRLFLLNRRETGHSAAGQTYITWKSKQIFFHKFKVYVYQQGLDAKVKVVSDGPVQYGLKINGNMAIVGKAQVVGTKSLAVAPNYAIPYIEELKRYYIKPEEKMYFYYSQPQSNEYWNTMLTTHNYIIIGTNPISKQQFAINCSMEPTREGGRSIEVEVFSNEEGNNYSIAANPKDLINDILTIEQQIQIRQEHGDEGIVADTIIDLFS